MATLTKMLLHRLAANMRFESAICHIAGAQYSGYQLGVMSWWTCLHRSLPPVAVLCSPDYSF